MKALSVISVAVILCSFGSVLAQVQSVGENFGRSWLEEHGVKSISENRSGNLWSWGGTPIGYSVQNGILAPSDSSAAEWFYPILLTNTTPIVLNSNAQTSYQNFSIPGFDPSNSFTDPWFLAQITGRPVEVKHTSQSLGSTLL